MRKISEDEYVLMSNYLMKMTGIDLKDNKKSLVNARLKNRLMSNNMKNFNEYYKYITSKAGEEEREIFINKMTTNHTFFMREGSHFDYLNNVVFPEIEERHKTNRDLRLWCAGCSTGEEAYILAILADKFFGTKSWNTEILATDISTEVLQKASDGIYKKANLKDVPKSLIDDYFEEYDEEQMQVIKRIRKKIVFRKLNLITDRFRFKRQLQVIFCRNVMIYFDTDTKIILLQKFYDSMEPEGFLFISHSETLTGLNDELTAVSASVYKK